MFLYKVSWIEHVEVNGKLQTHTMYIEVLSRVLLHLELKKWLAELQRMSERFASAAVEYISSYL